MKKWWRSWMEKACWGINWGLVRVSLLPPASCPEVLLTCGQGEGWGARCFTALSCGSVPALMAVNSSHPPGFWRWLVFYLKIGHGLEVQLRRRGGDGWSPRNCLLDGDDQWAERKNPLHSFVGFLNHQWGKWELMLSEVSTGFVIQSFWQHFYYHK